MEPTRPILTFNSWMLHAVKFSSMMSSTEIKEKLTMGSEGYLHNSTASLIPYTAYNKAGYFILSHKWVIDRSADVEYTIDCRTEEDAMMVIKILGMGEYHSLPMKKSPLRNTAINGNYTLKDVMDTFGDPLPDKIKRMILAPSLRNMDFFSKFQFFHQEWYPTPWWPEEFVYECPVLSYHSKENTAERHREILIWARDSGIDRHDMVFLTEGFMFRHSKDAMLFKLTWGEDPVFDQYLESLDREWESYVNLLYHEYKGF